MNNQTIEEVVKQFHKDIINMTDIKIDNLAEEALNSACLTIQNVLHIEYGDFASIFFSDNEVKNKLIEYIKSEIQNKVNE